MRTSITWFLAFTCYLPLIILGKLMKPFNLSQFIPLYEGYQGKSMGRIRQDVFDRFFTNIEQRFSKKQIEQLKDTFDDIVVSENLPYWHFLCGDKTKLIK